MAQDNKNKVLNVPPLRFPEFTDEWKHIKVSELLQFYSTNSLSWEQLNYDDGDILNLHYGLIHKGVPTIVDAERETLPFISEGNEPRNYTVCRSGDVAFADASEDTNDVGKAIEFVNVGTHKIVCGLHTIHGRDKTETTIPGFKGYVFASTSFHNQVRRLAQGTKIYSISAKNFEEIFIGIPQKEEQTKIARLLYFIDERIATQNKIIEDLKKLKSAISHKLLFDAKMVETFVPLGELCELKNGYAFKSSSYCLDGKYKIITIANVQGDRFIKDDECKIIASIPNDIREHQLLKENSILISMTGNVGRVSLCKRGNYLLNQRVGLLVPKENEYTEYLYQVLSSKHFENSMIVCGQGAAQMNIGKSDIDDYMIPFSSNIKRIKQISDLLRAYDCGIETHKLLLEKYMLQKKYLLTKMFI